MSNAPVNHVGMTVAIDDLPPLIWHAELGDKLQCMWSGSNHRGVQLNDLREAVERWMLTYGQRCWLRQLTPYATREQEDELLRVIARMDGTAFPTTARLTGRWIRGRIPFVSDFTRDTSECQVFDAREISRGPIARVALPARIASGTHAHWAGRAAMTRDSRSPRIRS